MIILNILNSGWGDTGNWKWSDENDKKCYAMKKQNKQKRNFTYNPMNLSASLPQENEESQMICMAWNWQIPQGRLGLPLFSVYRWLLGCSSWTFPLFAYRALLLRSQFATFCVSEFFVTIISLNSFPFLWILNMVGFGHLRFEIFLIVGVSLLSTIPGEGPSLFQRTCHF